MSDQKTDREEVRRVDRASGDADLTPNIREEPLPAPRRSRSRGVRLWLRGVPFVALASYYALLIGVMIAVSSLSPTIRSAFFSPAVVRSVNEEVVDSILAGQPIGPGGAMPVVSTEREALRRAGDRSLQTLLVIVGALLLVYPVAWVYMQTKRLRFDPALVRSVVILPIVVAGITMVVKSSVALAFALAGIVAAVRFRNTLKDPRDAVYIFLVIGIGLASGVQALDVALVMSMLFNFVMLTLWRYNIGSIYGGGYGETGVLSVGDSALLVAHIPDVRKRIRRALLDEADDLETDGILLVHAEEVDFARTAAQEALSEMAKDWRLARIAPRSGGVSTLEYLVRLKKKSSPADLVGALEERWSEQVQAAEYFPFRKRESERAYSVGESTSG